jgi:hypothetical protein
MLDHRKVEKNKDAMDYFTRSGTNTGLFNLDGALSEKQCGELKEKLANTESIIWHGFISFDTETTQGFKSQDQAIQFMKQSFGAFLERTHLRRDNLEIFAALHTDAAHHHHIHFSFFEKEPKRPDKNGNPVYTKKGSFESAAIDNYLVSANMHLSENSRDYYTARDRAMDRFKSIRLENVVRADYLRLKLEQLVKKLPKTGRLQYNSENIKPLRHEIDELSELLLRADPQALKLHQDMQYELSRKEQEVKRLAADNKLAYVNGKRMNSETIKELLEKGRTKYIEESYIDLEKIDYIDKLRLDYKSRLGNRVLGLCKAMRKEYGDNRKAKVNERGKKIAARRRRANQGRVLADFMKALASYQRGIQADFTKSLAQIEREIETQKAE